MGFSCAGFHVEAIANKNGQHGHLTSQAGERLSPGRPAQGQSLSVLLSECRKGITYKHSHANLVADKHGRKKKPETEYYERILKESIIK